MTAVTTKRGAGAATTREGVVAAVAAQHRAENAVAARPSAEGAVVARRRAENAVAVQHRAENAVAAQHRAENAVAARRRARALLVLLTATAGAAVVLRGGYFAGGRAVFVLLAGFALLAAVLLDEGAAFRFLRSPPVLVTAALGALAALSAAWTVGDPTEAVSIGIVLLGLAAVAVAAGVAARLESSERIALVIVVLAAVAALAGLLGVALREEPWAQRIAGSWRPGGMFEYPPALALLQVAALPALLRWMVRAGPGPAAVAAAGAALAASTLALSESRLHLALAGLIALACVAWPWATVGRRRLHAAAAVALIVGAGVAADALAGGYVRPLATGGDAGRLLGLLAIPVGAAFAWTMARRALRDASFARRGPAGPTRGPAAPTRRLAAPTRRLAAPTRRPAALTRRLAALTRRLAAPALMAGAVLVAAVLATSPAVAGSGGFTHGRLALWGDAVATAAERPALGAGANGFLAASEERQDTSPTRYAHNLPLELAVELGIAGLLLALAFYAATGLALLRARGDPALWLLGPAVAAFPIANLLDWPWHLAGCGAVWALALGGLLAATPPGRRGPTLGGPVAFTHRVR